ncbi:aminoacyl--tRNA ligase-related protein [Thalassotalea fonticola]|uniref:Aminoacyl--tRNA ligase-related protein n=1 Tax=Thalassotalea fonticola TaxID=3065649 RepID=A0ABZ0GUM2_9GAMM|nr:aminoacyl--tRNA ligase-related protein [Colwelliaceae bacterium S1-1]
MCFVENKSKYKAEQLDDLHGGDLQWHDLQWHSDGYAALSGDLLKYLNLLDARIEQWAEQLNAVQYLFPNFISIADLAPTGYCDSFPHLATFAYTPEPESDNLNKFKQSAINSNATTPSSVNENVDWQATKQVLTPASCYHFYHRFKNHSLDETRYLTTKCTCHRREEFYAPLQRQWNFTMREVVCLSDPNGIDKFIETAQAFISTFANELGLNASWQQASDPFFDPSNDSKAISQLVEPVKQELCLKNGLAIASTNNHRSFFSDCYNISLNGKPARTACVAFGLERWLFALLSQHGNNFDKWPLGETL